MRVSLGQLGGLGAYPFPLTPFTTLTGRHVSDPGSEQATWEDCLPYMCGANPTESLPRMWCSFWGRSGARACVDNQCAPWRSMIPACSLPTPLPTPEQPRPTPPPPIPTLTPQNIIQPLPDIAQPLEPVVLAVPDCSLWCVINGAIAENPALAVAALAGLALLLWPKGRA